MSTSLLDTFDGGDTEEDEPAVTLKRSNNDNEVALEEGNAPVEELLKKKVKLQKPFTAEILCGRDGLLRIYENFPREDMFRGRGFELQDMKKMFKMYKEWGFQMHPGLNFQDLLSKCETIGTKAIVKDHMKTLRDRERDKYVHEVLGVPLAQISSRNEIESKSKKEKVTGNDDMSTRDFLDSLEGSSSSLTAPPINNTMNGYKGNTADGSNTFPNAYSSSYNNNNSNTNNNTNNNNYNNYNINNNNNSSNNNNNNMNSSQFTETTGYNNNNNNNTYNNNNAYNDDEDFDMACLEALEKAEKEYTQKTKSTPMDVNLTEGLSSSPHTTATSANLNTPNTATPLDDTDISIDTGDNTNNSSKPLPEANPDQSFINMESLDTHTSSTIATDGDDIPIDEEHIDTNDPSKTNEINSVVDSTQIETTQIE